MNNIVYVRWSQDAAVAHSTAVDLGMEEYLRRGATFVVRRHEVDYLSPAFAGDVVEVETRVTGVTPVTAERHTLIRREADGQVLARASTYWVFVSLATGRPLRIPEDVRQRFPLEPPALEPTRRGKRG